MGEEMGRVVENYQSLACLLMNAKLSGRGTICVTKKLADNRPARHGSSEQESRGKLDGPRGPVTPLEFGLRIFGDYLGT